MQLLHQNTQFQKKNFPIILICDHIIKAPNVGSLFRVADAFGIDKIIFCGSHTPMGRRMTKTSRATEKIVGFEVVESTLETVRALKTEGYQILALEITSNSIPIHVIRLEVQPTCLIIGNENHGISAAVLEMCNAVVHINMFGHNSSMNVVQATAIALYELTKK